MGIRQSLMVEMCKKSFDKFRLQDTSNDVVETVGARWEHISPSWEYESAGRVAYEDWRRENSSHQPMGSEMESIVEGEL